MTMTKMSIMQIVHAFQTTWPRLSASHLTHTSLKRIQDFFQRLLDFGLALRLRRALNQV